MHGQWVYLTVCAPPAPRRSRFAACWRVSAAGLASVPVPDLSQRMSHFRFSAAPEVQRTKTMSRSLTGTFRSFAGDYQCAIAALNSISPDCAAHKTTPLPNWRTCLISLDFCACRRSNLAVPVEKQTSKSHIAEP